MRDARATPVMGAGASAESQWEHQARHAMDLFLGTMALVGSFLCWMAWHLRARRRRRAEERERLIRGVDAT